MEFSQYSGMHPVKEKNRRLRHHAVPARNNSNHFTSSSGQRFRLARAATALCHVGSNAADSDNTLDHVFGVFPRTHVAFIAVQTATPCGRSLPMLRVQACVREDDWESSPGADSGGTSSLIIGRVTSLKLHDEPISDAGKGSTK